MEKSNHLIFLHCAERTVYGLGSFCKQATESSGTNVSLPTPEVRLLMQGNYLTPSAYLLRPYISTRAPCASRPPENSYKRRSPGFPSLSSKVYQIPRSHLIPFTLSSHLSAFSQENHG